MDFIYNQAFQQWAVEFIAVIFVVALVFLGIGVGLIVASAATLRFLARMNRWVPTRRAFRPLEVPYNTGPTVQKHRRWLAVVFVAGAAVALYGLIVEFDARAVSVMFGLNPRSSMVTAWLIDAGRWALIVGNLAALVIGVMLGLFPDALAALEARGGRWYSDRQLKAADEMNLTLDNWVAASPRAAGWLITVAAVVLLGAFGIILSVLR